MIYAELRDHKIWITIGCVDSSLITKGACPGFMTQTQISTQVDQGMTSVFNFHSYITRIYSVQHAYALTALRNLTERGKLVGEIIPTNEIPVKSLHLASSVS